MKKKIFRNVLIAIVLVLFAGFIFIYTTAKRSLPVIDGELNIEGLKDEVIVTRDDKGVPSIQAKNDEDLYFAQGFIQAQDRLFQMDLARRQASGRLSEIIGESALENDKKFLLFDLKKSAERSESTYSEETKQILNSFANGVNTFIKYAKENNKLSYEFKLLGYEPEDWTIVDTLTIGKYMAYDLGGHYDYQAFNNILLNKFGEQIFGEINKETISKDRDIQEIIEINKEFPIIATTEVASVDRPSIDNGSNNWVLAGSKTKSGKPLLADDPHLSLSIPSIWYQMHLISPSQNVSGVIFTGVPGIILGNNEDIAWGVTNYGPDVQDLYIEKRNPENRHQFELDGEYYDAKIIKHEIKVKSQDSVPFDLEYSRNGIIVDGLVKMANPNASLSMRWTAHDATSELQAILDINKAKNWEEFEKALEKFMAPAQNFVFADKDGNIALKSNGNIPIRKKGNAILPVPGYDSSFGWDSYVSYDKLPKQLNPESGFLATANTETGTNIDYHTSNIFAQPYRINRINEVLSEDKKFDIEDMKNLQMDIKNLAADEFLDYFLENVDTNIIDSKILEALKSWDRHDDKDSLAALIFNKWLYKVQDYIFDKSLTEEEFEFMSYKDHYSHNLLRMEIQGEKSKFIENLGGIKTVLENSYKEMMDDLKEDLGQNINEWTWGKAHRFYLKHSLGSANVVLEKFLSTKQVEMSGSKYTVLAARENKYGNVNHGASWRFVYDASTGEGEHIVVPGQSGHFMSEHYMNQVDNWLKGDYNKINMDNINEINHLILKPIN